VTLVTIDAAGEETEMEQPGGDLRWSSLHNMDIWHDFACLSTLNCEQSHEDCDTQKINMVKKQIRNCDWHRDQPFLNGMLFAHIHARFVLQGNDGNHWTPTQDKNNYQNTFLWP
jgi:hypothetical protein